MSAENDDKLPATTKDIVMPRGRSFLDRIAVVLREIIAIIFWLYVIVKLFVYDVDVDFMNTYFPGYTWILNFKIIFFLIIVGAAFFVSKWSGLLRYFFYVIFYPIILVLWRLPMLIWKQKNWTLAFMILSGCFSFLKHIRYNITIICFYLVSLLIEITGRNKTLLYTADFVLFLILAAEYIHRVQAIFKPGSLFDFCQKYLSKIRTPISSMFVLDEELKNLPVPNLTNGQLQQWRSKLEMAALVNRILRLLSVKLRNYQRSGLPILFGAAVSLGMVIFTALTFAAVNFGAYKIDSDTFAVHGVPTFFSFFYYSFHSMFFSGISMIRPSAEITQSLLMIQYLLSLFLVAIFLSLLVKIRSQRYSQELDQAILALERKGDFVETVVRDDYHFPTIDEAIAELERFESGMLKLLLFISRPLR